MNRRGLILFALLLGTLTMIPSTSAIGGKWKNRYSYEVDNNNNSFTSTFFIGPQVFWDGSNWNELKFEDLGDGYLLENSMITAYIYNWYTVFYDPDNQRVCVDDERWIVEVYNTKNKKWREVDLYDPSLSYSNNATHLTVTRTFNNLEGLFSITYILQQGARLKHEIKFISKMSGDNQFRATMKLTGIHSNKVKHSGGTEIITAEKHIMSPYFVFGENNNNLIFSERLWSLGEFNVISVFNETSATWFNVTTDEWLPTTLKDVIIDISASGTKMDVIIGNYILANNESFLIDPDSDTWVIGQSSDDANDENAGFSLVRTNPAFNYYGLNAYPDRFGMRWTGITIPPGSTISSATIIVKAAVTESKAGYSNNYQYGVAEDNATTFSTLEDLYARDLTGTYDSWTFTTWSANQWYTSGELDTEVQAIIDRDGWESGNSLAIISVVKSQASNEQRRIYTWDNNGGSAPQLNIIWVAAGGTNYPRSATQGISLSPNADRLFNGIRAATQSITASVDANRLYVALRNAAQALTLSSDTARTYQGTREPTQSLGISTDADRSFTGSRDASQGVTLASLATRIRGMIRNPAQSIGLTSAAERLATQFRAPTQAISTIVDADRLATVFRAPSQSIGLSSLATRIRGMIRDATQSLSLAASTLRSYAGQRNPTQTLNAASSGARLFTGYRGANQTLNLSENATRKLDALRSASQGFTVSTNSTRLYSGGRGPTQTLNIATLSDRVSTLARGASQIITTALDASRLTQLLRNAANTLTLVFDAAGVHWTPGGGPTHFIRFASQTISTVFDASSVLTKALVAYVRGATLSLNIGYTTSHSLINILIQVIDRFGEALAGSNVALYYGGSLLEGGEVNATGHYLADNVPQGNYTIDAYRTDYAPQKLNYLLVTSYNIEITLQTFEEAIMFNMELLILVGTGMLLSLGFYLGERVMPWFIAIIMGALSGILFLASGFYWTVTAPSIQVYGWLFTLWGIINLILVTYFSIGLMRSNQEAYPSDRALYGDAV